MSPSDGLRIVRGSDEPPSDPPGGSPSHHPGDNAPQAAGPADGPEAFRRGRDTVLAVSTRVTGRTDLVDGAGPPTVSGGAFALPSLRAEERRLLGLVDGRLSIARLAHLASLSEETTARHLQALAQRGILVPVEPNEVTIRGQSGVPFFRLGAYEIAARIGQGGMGSVYVCRRNGAAGFRRLFTLKVLREDSGQEDAAVRTFMREIRVGGLLDHPNVQSVCDVGMYKDQPFLVLQYVDGTDLEELTALGGALSADVVVPIMLDVLRGLQRAHDLADEHGTALGLIHSDVSPPNILVGVDGLARIADFGNVRFTELGETDQPDPMALGKPAYMAPEQFRGERLDRRVDIFAVGAVMWSALTGRDLFAAESYDQIVENVMTKIIEPPSAHGANPCLDDVCMRALSRERQWRYGSADEMAAELHAVAAANRLVGSATEVAERVRQTLGEMLVDRRKRIELAFEGTQQPPAPAAEAAGEMDAVPAVAEAKIARTVVLPPRTGHYPTLATRRRSRWNERWKAALDSRMVLWFAIGVLLAMIGGLLVTSKSKRPVRHQAVPEAAPPPSIPPPTPDKL